MKRCKPIVNDINWHAWRLAAAVRVAQELRDEYARAERERERGVRPPGHPS